MEIIERGFDPSLLSFEYIQFDVRSNKDFNQLQIISRKAKSISVNFRKEVFN